MAESARKNLAPSLVRIAHDALALTDKELADCLGSSIGHVRALYQGLYLEHLTAEQKRNLLMYARFVRDRAIDAVAEMELLS